MENGAYSFTANTHLDISGKKSKCQNINNVCYGNPQPEVNIAAWILRESTALPTQLAAINYVSYQSPTKVLFSLVSGCLFMWGPHVTNTHYALDLTVQPPSPSDMRPIGSSPSPPPLVTSGGNHCRPVQTCSLDQYWHLVAKACTIGKRAARILLECFLVASKFQMYLIKRIEVFIK